MHQELEKLGDIEPTDPSAVVEQSSIIKPLVNELHAECLAQYSGVIAAAVHGGCSAKLHLHFKASIVFIVEARKLTNAGPRWTKPKLMSVMGNTKQLDPDVQSGTKELWSLYEPQFGMPTLARAVAAGEIVKDTLMINHRPRGTSMQLPSSFLTMASCARPGCPQVNTTNWQTRLRKKCPEMDVRSRILIEIQNAQVDRVVTSYSNMAHVNKPRQIVPEILCDPALNNLDKPITVMCIPTYKAQVDVILKMLDELVISQVLTLSHRRSDCRCCTRLFRGCSLG